MKPTPLCFIQHSPGRWWLGEVQVFDRAAVISPAEISVTAMRIVLARPRIPVAEATLREAVGGITGKRIGPRAHESWQRRAIELVEPYSTALANELRAVERRGGAFTYWPAGNAPEVLTEDPTAKSLYPVCISPTDPARSSTLQPPQHRGR